MVPSSAFSRAIAGGHRRSSAAPLLQHEVLSLLGGTLRISDFAAAPLCGLLAYYLRYRNLQLRPDEALLVVLATVMSGNIMRWIGAYNPYYLHSLRAALTHVIGGWTATIALLLVIAFFDKIADQTSRMWIGYWLIAGASFLILSRLLAAAYLGRLRKAGLSVKVAIVANQPVAERIARQIASASDFAIAVVGVFAPRFESDALDSGIASDATVSGLLRIARQSGIDEIIVHLPDTRDAGFIKILFKLTELPVNVRLCPDLSGLPVSSSERGAVISVSRRPFSGWTAIVKRAEDVVLSSLLLPFFAPLVGLIALLIKLDSPGPVFFLQRRLGFNGNHFLVYKFRTMTVEASRDPSAPQARRNDPRVTRVGKYLRRTSLDELPQILNVLKGDMSLVGPRPHAIPLNEHYATIVDGYLRRHCVKPGITGWAQVNGWRGETSNDEAMIERVKHDLAYIENWSLRFDLSILALTLLVGFRHPNAY
jgi:Undecaprenyl-phosphate glucose phosphotransferase